MRPHSLRDLGLTASTSSDSYSKDIDIKLNQDRSQFFSPGTVVSGWVVFFGSEKQFHLEVEFFGRTRTEFRTSQKSHSSKLSYADETILFSYKRPLDQNYRPGNSDWTQDSHWKIEFRFPSSTENRRTVIYQRALPGRWCDSVHPLPPTLEHNGPHCSFSVEYILRARVYVDKRLLAETEVPLLFAPTRPVVGFSSLSPLQPPNSPRSDTFQAVHPSLNISRAAPLRSRSRSLDGSSTMTIYPPIDITTGQTMSIRAEVRFSALPEDRDIVEPSFFVQIEELQLFCYTSCRGKVTGGSVINEADMEETTSVPGKIDLDVHNPSSTFEPVSVDTFAFSIEARVPDRLLPSFASFIVCNRYSLHARIVAKAWEHEHRACLVIDDVQVVSPPRAPVPARRTSPPMVGPVPPRRR